MLKMIFTGNLASDAKTGTTKKGKQTCNFDVAVRGAQYFNLFAGDSEGQTVYIQVTAWGKLGEQCARFLTKGRGVTIVGRGPQFKVYKSPRYGDARLALHVDADDVEFGNNQTRPPVPENAGEAPQPEPAQEKNFVPEGFVEVSPEELPF